MSIGQTRERERDQTERQIMHVYIFVVADYLSSLSFEEKRIETAREGNRLRNHSSIVLAMCLLGLFLFSG